MLRTCLWASCGLLGFASLLSVFLAIVDPRTFGILSQMIALSFAVGREAAMLYAYSQGPALGPTWVLAAAILQDLVTLCLTLPLVWIALQRLRGVYFVGGIVLALEKAAVEKRAFLRRWGLLGLVAFVWFPGIGAGVFLAATIGIVSKIPFRPLLLALGLGSMAVNAFWGIGLYYTSGLIPREGIWSFIPLACIAALAVLAVVFGLLERRKRHLFPIVKVQILGKRHVARLLDVGITDGIDLLYVNRKILASKLGMDPALLGRLRSVAELSMLRTISPPHAQMLTAVGITSIRELSVAPPELVAAALRELEPYQVIAPVPDEAVALPQKCQQWTHEARVFMAASVA